MYPVRGGVFSRFGAVWGDDSGVIEISNVETWFGDGHGDIIFLYVVACFQV